MRRRPYGIGVVASADPPYGCWEWSGRGGFDSITSELYRRAVCDSCSPQLAVHARTLRKEKTSISPRSGGFRPRSS